MPQKLSHSTCKFDKNRIRVGIATNGQPHGWSWFSDYTHIPFLKLCLASYNFQWIPLMCNILGILLFPNVPKRLVFFQWMSFFAWNISQMPFIAMCLILCKVSRLWFNILDCLNKALLKICSGLFRNPETQKPCNYRENLKEKAVSLTPETTVYAHELRKLQFQKSCCNNPSMYSM